MISDPLSTALPTYLLQSDIFLRDLNVMRAAIRASTDNGDLLYFQQIITETVIIHKNLMDFMCDVAVCTAFPAHKPMNDCIGVTVLGMECTERLQWMVSVVS